MGQVAFNDFVAFMLAWNLWIFGVLAFDNARFQPR